MINSQEQCINTTKALVMLLYAGCVFHAHSESSEYNSYIMAAMVL